MIPRPSPRRPRLRRLPGALATACALLGGAAQADGVYLGGMKAQLTPASQALLMNSARTPGGVSGDIIEVVLSATVAAGSGNETGGPGAYFTAYPQPGVEVLGAAFVTDATGATVRPPGQGGHAPTGWGGRGSRAPYGTPYLTAQDGRLNDLNGDTGIFYSTDARTAAYTSDGSLILRGTTGNPRGTGPTANGYNVKDTFNGLVDAYNLWDANQVNAFGAGGTLGVQPAPSDSTATVINRPGTGTTPFNAGSPVAGPDTGYTLDNTGATGPWQRIRTSGAQKANTSDGPVTATTGAAGTIPPATSTPDAPSPFPFIDASATGYPLSDSTPLPAGTNAVRFSYGLAVTGQQIFVKIRLRVSTASLADSSGVLVNFEANGSDNQGSGSKDNPWRYFGPTVAVISGTAVDKTLAKVNGADYSGGPVPAGSVLTYRVRFLNTSLIPISSITVRDALPSAIATTGCSAATPSLSGLSGGVTVGSVSAGTSSCPAAGASVTFANLPSVSGGRLGALDGGEFTYDVRLATGLAVGSTVTNSVQVSSADAGSDASLSTTDANSVTIGPPSADLAVSKAGPAAAVQGDLVNYTIRAWNNGLSPVSGATLADAVPTHLSGVSWTCAATGSASCASSGGSGNAVSLGVTLPVDGGPTSTPDSHYVTLTVTGTVRDAGDITNTATITPPGGVTESAPANNTSSVGTRLTALMSCSTLYATVGGNFGTSANGGEIRPLNAATNVLGGLIAALPATAGGQAAYTSALALTPDRSRFFVVRDADSRLLAFDVATNTWVVGGQVSGAGSRLARMAITPGNAGYLMDSSGNLYGFSTTAPYAVSAATALQTQPSTAPAFGSGGDLVADAQGRLLLLGAQTGGQLDLWEVEPAEGRLVYLGRITDSDLVGTYDGFAATPGGLYGRSGAGGLVLVDPGAGSAAPVASPGPGSSDLAGCTFPGFTRAVTAQKTASKVAGAAGPDVVAGDTLEYRIVVRNAGTLAAGDVQFQDQVPAGSTYLPGSTSLNGVAVPDALVAVMPYTLAGQRIASPGQGGGVLLADDTPAVADREAVIRFRVTVDALPPAQLSNQGMVSYRDGAATQTVQTDDPATPAAGDPTVTPVKGPDVSLVKSGPAAARPAAPLVYTLSVRNLTAVPALAVVVHDPLDAALTFESASDGGVYEPGSRTVTWVLGSLAGGAQRTLTLTVTAPPAGAVSPPDGVKSVRNAATVGAAQDSDASNNVSAVVTPLILSELGKRVRNVSAGSAFGTSGRGLPGEVLEYCLDASNLGGADLAAYGLSDQVPGTTAALTTAYDPDEPSALSGFGIRVVRGAATTYLSSSAADTDGGSLSLSGGGFGRGSLTVGLGTLLAGETASACFQVNIR